MLFSWDAVVRLVSFKQRHQVINVLLMNFVHLFFSCVDYLNYFERTANYRYTHARANDYVQVVIRALNAMIFISRLITKFGD